MTVTTKLAHDMLDMILTELANIQDLPVVQETVAAIRSVHVDIEETGMVAANLDETIEWCNYERMGGGVYQAKNGDLVIVTSLPGTVRMLAIPRTRMRELLAAN